MNDAESHYRKLERLYLQAPVNQYYRPTIRIAEGEAEVGIDARPDLLHAGGAVHGSVYFKLLDDSCFFAVNSVVPDVFVLTASFSVYLTRPVTEGGMVGIGKVVHSGSRMFIAEGQVVDQSGRIVGRGSGSFMRSDIVLNERVGYV
ncbi:MAG: PaaI family thioesterase [Acidobacteriota bacterium]|nr:PaaI family thioesterase [Acidobacteriota bacterium]